MIDTVMLAFNIAIHTDLLSQWDQVTTNLASGKRFSKCCLNVKLNNGAEVKCTYFPFSFDRAPLLHVEFSLPNVLLGNNYEMVYDMNWAIPGLKQALARIEGLPALEVGSGIVRRVDACYNHQVGNAVPYYIRALIPLEYPYRKTKPYTGQGVQYMNKQVATKFYDKEKECGQPAAFGILRQETTLRREAVKKLTGKKQPTLYDLTPERIKQALERDLDDLGLLGRSIGTMDTTLKELCFRYGSLAGIFYSCLLQAKVKLSKEMIASATNYHPRSINRILQKIVDVNIPLTLTETVEPLPPLIIEMDNLYPNPPKLNVSKNA